MGNRNEHIESVCNRGAGRAHATIACGGGAQEILIKHICALRTSGAWRNGAAGRVVPISNRVAKRKPANASPRVARREITRAGAAAARRIHAGDG